jgi:dTDP-4-amino-4,6-dideoxy-D-galactose acyltransferase
MKKTYTGKVCEFLPWDTAHFGIRIAKASVSYLDENVIENILYWCAIEGIKCLYFLTILEDQKTIRLVEENNFKLVDVRITLETQIRNVSTNNVSSLISPSKPEDISFLQRIAKVSHQNTRFYFDNNFPKLLCDYLYETWIEKSCKGYADKVFVARYNGKPVGYISCHEKETKEGVIGLFAVDKKYRGLGLAKQLINKSIEWFSMSGCQTISVVTQGRNIIAQNLYQKMGFMTKSVQIWYHKWFDE